MAISGDFVDALERYFGPWRGEGVKAELARWLTEQNVPKLVLQAVYRELTESRKIQPVNTIGIADLDAALDRYYETPRPSDARQIEGPDAMPREQGGELLRDFRENTLSKLCDAKNVKTAPVVEEVSF